MSAKQNQSPESVVKEIQRQTRRKCNVMAELPDTIIESTSDLTNRICCTARRYRSAPCARPARCR